MNAKQNENVEQLYTLFNEYRSAYAAEWERLDRCERVYRGEHWQDVPVQDENEPRPVTPVIQSTIENVRADLMDQMPEAIVLAPDGQFPARPDARLQLLPVFDGYSLCVCTKDAARVALREL